MKKTQAILFGALLMSTAALAQETDSSPPAEEPANQTQSGGAQPQGETNQDPPQDEGAAASASEAVMDEQTQDQVRSAQLIGSAIVNQADEEIGTIDDLLLDKEGRVVGIIVGVGGFLGMGEKHVALSWDAVEITPAEGEANYQVRTDLDRAALEEAPAFRTEEQQQAEQQQRQMMEQQQQPMGQPAAPPVEQQ